ncbi:cyclomaltodextrinase C-terminal domain-containing protein [Simiduia sp. 21SJ11W-1]|uniref:alpha-amylase family glycosyl hydrolase n=1 Tax=Simiduia sp. 21SJ11W-1 TaxID=2909669 RepID=UPI00209E5347|nr:alpha-amylase family glycosyl hydrolase [Simiduia sp. 21SJ11W-1]UTA47727.1 cyclomaltodextrinase C-terminal domain-containing protein [Simiduia sp. 21SJ11W-1]
MAQPELELMVYGKAIASYQPKATFTSASAADGKALPITHVTRTNNEDYLFITLDLAGIQTQGTALLTFNHAQQPALTYKYAIKSRSNTGASRKGFDGRDFIYLITPDRFANGDPTNDTLAAYADKPDRADPYGRHGGDLQGIINQLDYLQSLGVTQLWLNPVTENAMPKSSYHGYAATDLYKIDPRYGDLARYRELAEQARARGMGLIIDLVPNHIGLQHWWMHDLPSDDWINNGGQFVATNHMRESLQDPHAARADQRAFQEGWFVPSMPDLNQRNPQLATYLTQNAIWWIETAALSGIRVDTWSYSDKAFLKRWVADILHEYPGLTLVGEEWSTDPEIIAYWQAGKYNSDGYQTQLPSLFDFPLQLDLMAALTEPESWNTGLVKLYRVLARDGRYANAQALTIFLDNHDMSRAYTQLGHNPALTRMALTLLATLRGIPQMFYGTEILMGNPGTDSHGVIRSDFPGGWPGDNTNGFTGHRLSDDAKATQDYVRDLFQWRKTATAIHTGKLRQYAPKNGTYAFFRYDNRSRFLIALNKNPARHALDLTPMQPDLAGFTQARDVLAGKVYPLDKDLPLAATSATIFELLP